MRASDGAVQGTYAVGTSPSQMAFDGANIWLSHTVGGLVTKLHASDGAIQGTFPAGSVGRGVAFDGANIWVVGASSNDVTKIPVFP